MNGSGDESFELGCKCIFCSFLVAPNRNSNYAYFGQTQSSIMSHKSKFLLFVLTCFKNALV